LVIVEAAQPPDPWPQPSADVPNLQREIEQRKMVEAELVAANLRLTEALESLAERSLDMELFNQFGEQLLRCETLEDACAEAVKTGMELFASAAGRLLLLPLGGGSWVETGRWGPLATFSAVDFEQLMRLDRPSVDCHVFEDGQLRLATVQDAHAAILIPLFVRSELHGAFQMQDAAMAFGRRAALTNFCQHLAMALANIRLRERLRDQSLRDPLTRLFNRRYFEEAFLRELKRSERHHTPMSVVMLDIDFFKRINDTYGHDVGDEVLRGLGSMAGLQMRTEDTLCRLGGEEFVALLPATGPDQAVAAAEKLRQAVRQLKFRQLSGLSGGISCSFGVATYPLHGQSRDALLHAADMALYRAKHSGRDRVELAIDADLLTAG
jgi:diguanylate cyclase (GGDEF)-like protein